MAILGFDHVQLAIPPGGEEAARAFYGRLLGLEEVAKPEHLQSRGGCWFETDSVRLHLGVERDFRPARKAHPGLSVTDLGDLVAALEAAGKAVTADADGPGGAEHVYVEDPFGNRLELVARRTD